MLDTRGLLWQDGTAYDLGGLIPWAINDSGQVVGSSGTTEGPEHAFLWDGGAMRDLNDCIPADSGWLLLRGTAISSDGQIVGFGILDGQKRAFLLTSR